MKIKKLITLLSSSLLLTSVGEMAINVSSPITANAKSKSTFKKGLPASFTTRLWGGNNETASSQDVQQSGYNSATTKYVFSIYKTTGTDKYVYIAFGDNNQHQVVDSGHYIFFSLAYSKKLGENHYLLSSTKNGKGTVIDYHYYEPNTASFNGNIKYLNSNKSYKNNNMKLRGYDNTQVAEYDAAMGENSNNSSANSNSSNSNN